MSTLKRYNGSTWDNISKNIIPLEDNGTTTAGTWLAKNSSVTSLVDGDLFLYKVAVAGASTTKLNINSLGAKTVYRVGTTKLTTQYGVGQYILLIYNSTNDCFRAINDSDANTYAYVRQYQMGNNEAGTTNLYPILTRYNLTNKNASYDTAYSRFHTETYIDMTNGYLYAPKLYSGGTEVSVEGHTHSQYLTGITSSQVTNALGYTPYNSTNPNGYITSSALSSYVPTSRTINGKALSSDIILSASDVQALDSTTSYVKSASVSGNTLTLTTTGLPVTYTPSISTAYLSDTPTSRSDSDTTTNYLIGKSSTSATGTNYYNSKVYFKGNKLYSNGTEVSVVGHTHSNYLTSHLYRPIQMNGTQILANSSSSALNLVAGTGITLSNSSGSVTIASSGGSVSGFYHEIVTVNGTAKHFSTEGSGKVIITSIENDLISGWFFRLIDSQSLIIENILYAEIMTVNNSPVGLNFIDTSGTWGSLSYDADWDSFDTWVIDSPMGSGDVSISYIGDF